MNRIDASLIAIVVSLVLPGWTHGEKAARSWNVVLIGWDGCQRQHLKECIARNEVPNLMRLASEGDLVAIDILRTTDTKAGWTQILTGYEPEKTGVFSNRRYGPIPVGYTIFERVEKHFGPENIVTVAIIGKKNHVDADPPSKTRVLDGGTTPRRRRRAPRDSTTIEERGIKYWVVPGKPYFHTKDNMDVFINGLGDNEKVGQTALEYLERCKDRRFFLFVHFAEPDHVGHKYGENSKEYNEGIISDDVWTGRIMDKLKALGLYDRTLIYVTSDHGFDEGRDAHLDAPYVFLATNDPKVIRQGERCDIAPTILTRLGVDLRRLSPPLDGRPLTTPLAPPIW
ncbi:MAG TPA: alkaline phosphatase family protein [Phycisphaerae bacterium]|nr:alkaline phosphatase family protein [Phycisphaerae bacterium]